MFVRRSTIDVRVARLALALLLLWPRQASADWLLKPFVGVTFGGGTTLVDLDEAAGNPNLVIGFSGGLVGEIVGVEGDFGFAPGFFQAGGNNSKVISSAVTTLTGNVIVAAPRHLTQYTLRPYFVGGFGLMHASIQPRTVDLLATNKTFAAVDFGGGVTGFLSERVGLNWEGRYFRSVGESGPIVNFGPDQLSFWRANMAIVIRF